MGCDLSPFLTLMLRRITVHSGSTALNSTNRVLATHLTILYASLRTTLRSSSPPLTQMTRLTSFRSPTLVLSWERLSLSLSVETILIVS